MTKHERFGDLFTWNSEKGKNMNKSHKNLRNILTTFITKPTYSQLNLDFFFFEWFILTEKILKYCLKIVLLKNNSVESNKFDRLTLYITL
jgi:hypothetical protein